MHLHACELTSSSVDVSCSVGRRLVLSESDKLASARPAGFLGLTYSMTCKPQPMYKRLIANVFGPFVIILGALIGEIRMVYTFMSPSFLHIALF